MHVVERSARYAQEFRGTPIPAQALHHAKGAVIGWHAAVVPGALVAPATLLERARAGARRSSRPVRLPLTRPRRPQRDAARRRVTVSSTKRRSSAATSSGQSRFGECPTPCHTCNPVPGGYMAHEASMFASGMIAS
jgi:hypothetical protein